MVIGVPLALLAAGSARCRAGFEHSADDAEIGLRLARDDAAGGVANIGAVETQANAADQVPDVVFAETCVRAADASGGAVEAVADAAQKRLAIGAGRMWMRRDELLNGHFVADLQLHAPPTPHAAARSIGTPATDSVTSMFPRVALEYGQVSCARLMSSTAFARSIPGAWRSSAAASPKPPPRAGPMPTRAVTRDPVRSRFHPAATRAMLDWKHAA